MDIDEDFHLKITKKGQDNKMLNILLKDDDDLKLAHEKYEKFTSDKQLRWLAIDREKAVRDKIYHENMARRKGREEGLQEGKCLLKDSI